MAYDQTLSSQDYSANALKFGFYAQNVTTFTFEGTQAGSIDGTIQVPQPAAGGFWSTLFNGAINLGLSAMGQAGSSALKTIFNGGFSKLKINQIDSTALSYVATSAPITGLPKSIFNAILGKNSSGTGYSSEKVNLKMNTSIQLGGTGVDSPTGLGTVNSLLSGTQNLYSNDSGIIPLYTKKLGLFNIIGTPEIVLSTFYDFTGTSTINTAMFYLNESSFSVVWNPDVINQTTTGATIQNLKKEMVLITVTSPVPSIEPFDSEEYITIDGTTQKSLISSVPASFSRSTPGTVPKGLGWAPLVGTYGMRISFDIVPNDGSPKITIIKTIKAAKKVVQN